MRISVALALLLLHGAAAAADIQVSPNLAYATRDGDEMMLDLAAPGEGAGPFPLIIFIHGGGWQAGSRQDVLGAVHDAARRGYAAATVSYRFSPKHLWPAQIDDVRDAVRWLRAHAKEHKIDARRVAAVGWSAGGHLSLMLGCEPRGAEKGDAGVDAVVNFFGPTDMRKDEFNDAVDKLLADLAGGPRESRAAVFADFSPVAHVAQGVAPVLTFQGSKDELVPVEQARALHRALDAAKVPNRLELLEGRGHGWGGEDGERTKTQSFEFLDPYLKESSLPVVLDEDWTAGSDRWETTEPGAWKVDRAGGRVVFALRDPKGTYQPPFRSPLQIALAKGVEVTDFVLDLRVRSTGKENPHRDLCFFFGHQDPAHFYYVHLARKADEHAHSVFIVNGAPRVSIAKERTDGVEWGDAWHRVRVKREGAKGSIEVFFDDMTKPIMKAEDATFARGRVGFGTFDDSGEFADVRVRGTAMPARDAKP